MNARIFEHQSEILAGFAKKLSGYNFFCGVRQICWAHLKRDFKAKGAVSKIGQELYGLAKKILKMRKRVRDGTLQSRTFQERMAPLVDHV